VPSIVCLITSSVTIMQGTRPPQLPPFNADPRTWQVSVPMPPFNAPPPTFVQSTAGFAWHYQDQYCSGYEAGYNAAAVGASAGADGAEVPSAAEGVGQEHGGGEDNEDGEETLELNAYWTERFAKTLARMKKAEKQRQKQRGES
jgi:hypothetical protein